jgi:hypothetical protein
MDPWDVPPDDGRDSDTDEHPSVASHSAESLLERLPTPEPAEPLTAVFQEEPEIQRTGHCALLLAAAVGLAVAWAVLACPLYERDAGLEGLCASPESGTLRAFWPAWFSPNETDLSPCAEHADTGVLCRYFLADSNRSRAVALVTALADRRTDWWLHPDDCGVATQWGTNSFDGACRAPRLLPIIPFLDESRHMPSIYRNLRVCADEHWQANGSVTLFFGVPPFDDRASLDASALADRTDLLQPFIGTSGLLAAAFLPRGAFEHASVRRAFQPWFTPATWFTLLFRAGTFGPPAEADAAPVAVTPAHWLYRVVLLMLGARPRDLERARVGHNVGPLGPPYRAVHLYPDLISYLLHEAKSVPCVYK